MSPSLRPASVRTPASVLPSLVHGEVHLVSVATTTTTAVSIATLLLPVVVMATPSASLRRPLTPVVHLLLFLSLILLPSSSMRTVPEAPMVWLEGAGTLVGAVVPWAKVGQRREWRMGVVHGVGGLMVAHGLWRHGRRHAGRVRERWRGYGGHHVVVSTLS